VLHADENHYYQLAEKYQRQVSVFACVSERVGQVLRKRVREVDENDIYTIPCGINLPAVNNDHYTGDVLQLIYLGRISEYQKRTSDLVKICVRLREQNVPYHFNIVGDGETRQSLETKFAEAGLLQQVTFWGWRSQQEVAQRLAASDMLVMTSDFEGTPIAMMEALASGCGMCGTRVSGIEDYEDHPLAKDCFRIFEVGDAEDAVGKIISISAIPKTIRMESARKLAESEFSMTVCLSRYDRAMAGIKKSATAPGTVKLSAKSLLSSKAIAAARQLKLKLSR
jgi:glycosyltransferase involved in cell wall biosynthesis